MAKVSLRNYNKEIEGLVDQGATNEAIAHCHHILKTYPKHLETYRLLGKAYLESRKYAEAVDIFSRVLMAVPNDFVSHVGMSIINDEQNRLDDSIWHMERAFESQPSNPAIQGELQRLYARRDGMEPPKIRMTRGALANMYIQGELYPQAIAEIKAVLAQDNQRTDMQVLLARAYLKSGQKAEASELCTQLLKKHQYCFDANRIMADLTPANAVASESTKVFRDRVGELDPYSLYAKGSVFQTNEVADAAINLEKLVYTGDEVPMGQSWGSSLAISAGSSSETPDWLRSAVFTDEPASSEPVGTEAQNNSIPDFMRDAGWGQSSGPEQPVSFFDTPDPAAGNDAIVSADIPDWLKGQMPSAPASTPSADISEAIETPDWLSGLGGAQAPSFDSSQSSQQPSASTDTPDWLSGLGIGQPATDSAPAQDNTPDWLSGLGGDQPPSFETSQSVPQPSTSSDTPDWLSGLSESQPVADIPAAETSNTPDWLSGLGEAPADSSVEQKSDSVDWLRGLSDDAPQQPAANVETLGSSAQEQDDAVAWLESLAAKHGAKPEELVTDPSKRNETPPDWVQQAQASTPQTSQTVESAPAQQSNVPDWLSGLDEPKPAESAPDWLSSLGEATEESAPTQTGNVPDWLSGLGEADSSNESKSSGSAPEWLKNTGELSVIDEDAPTPAVPDWLSGLDAPASLPTTASLTPPNIETLGASAQEQDDAVAWLESLAAKHGAKPEELVTDPSKRNETPPDWVQQAQTATPQTSQPANLESLGSSAQEQDDGVAWLESLAEKQGAQPEELVTDPTKRSESPPEWIQQMQKIADTQKLPLPPEENTWSDNAQNIGEQFFAEFESAASAPPANVESLGASAQEQDDAVAWLESLAAKHGAKPEELVTDPNKRSDTPPDWVQQASAAGEAQKDSWAIEPESTSSTEDETGLWLKDLAAQEEKAKGPVGPAGSTDWLKNSQEQRQDIPKWLNTSSDDGQQEYVSQNLSKDDLSNWLSNFEDDAEPVATVKPEPVNTTIPEMPAWLSESDDDKEKADDWQIPTTASSQTEEPAPVQLSADLPDWLQDSDDDETRPEPIMASDEDDDVAPWHRRESWEANEDKPQPTPTSPTDWQPAEEKADFTPRKATNLSAPRPAPKSKPSTPVEREDFEIEPPIQLPPRPAKPPVQTPKPVVQKTVSQPQPVAEEKQQEQPVVKISKPVKKTVSSAAKGESSGGVGSAALEQAKGELDRGDIPAALEHYEKLIKRGKYLEDTIRDLTDSLYRYPVEVGIWQTLGDAYMRANRLKEALEAYNKAEELIR